jgi:hypothetical protein
MTRVKSRVNQIQSAGLEHWAKRNSPPGDLHPYKSINHPLPFSVCVCVLGIGIIATLFEVERE